MSAADSTDRQLAEVMCSARLERVFNDCFYGDFNTRLIGGAEEPLYQPAEAAGDCHRIYYREDYFASALHEVAHWCIAGPQRRLLTDFGYWYAPDGRNASQQRAFESVEYQPQAMEWHFARACGFRFRISMDNLDGGDGVIEDIAPFRQRILAQARRWQQRGLPRRAARFVDALRLEFARAETSEDFTMAELM